MPITFHALPTEQAVALQQGGLDAYGLRPEERVSDGSAIPCRHCLEPVAEGERYLVLAHKPFASLQPYAETGPIFIHAEPCERAEPTDVTPEMLSSPSYIVRGYDADKRIIYGAGGVVPTEAVAARAEEIFANEAAVFVHVRSAQNNCFQCRVERDDTIRRSR